MISKRSFLDDIATNLKRRNWLIIINFLVMFFVLPVYTASAISLEKTYNKTGDLPYILGSVFERHVIFNPFSGFLITILALMGGIQGFSYMYKKKKLDMYMSVPVSKERRFFAIYINGMAIFVVTYIVNMILAFMIAAAMGCDVSYGASHVPEVLTGFFLLYFSVYNAAILAAMLTGHMAVTIMGAAVFLSIDGLYTLLVTLYMDLCFKSHYNGSDINLFKKYVISPFLRFVIYANECYDYTGEQGYGWRLDSDLFSQMTLVLFITGVIYLAAAYYLYTVKPAESAGKAMAFKVSRPIVKVVVATAVSHYAGLIMYTISGKSKAFMFFGFAVGLLITHGFMEAVYDFDIRSCKKGLTSLAVSAVAVISIYAVFALDITGFDRYVPRESDIESIAVFFPDEWSMNYYDQDMKDIGRNRYLAENVKLEDTSSLLELAQNRMGMDPQEAIADNKQTRSIVAAYNLKNNKTIYRMLYALCEEDEELLNRILTDPGYRNVVWNVYDDGFIKRAEDKKVRLTLDMGMGGESVDISFRDFADAYKKDLEYFDFSSQKNGVPLCMVSLSSSDYNVYIFSNYPVYPSFDNTLKLFKDKGISDTAIKPQWIESLIIEYQKPVDYREISDSPSEALTVSEMTSKQVEIKDPEKIKEITPAIYPSFAREFWMWEGITDNNYIVTVNFRFDSFEDGRPHYGTTFGLLKDKIPDFLKKEME